MILDDKNPLEYCVLPSSQPLATNDPVLGGIQILHLHYLHLSNFGHWGKAYPGSLVHAVCCSMVQRLKQHKSCKASLCACLRWRMWLHTGLQSTRKYRYCEPHNFIFTSSVNSGFLPRTISDSLCISFKWRLQCLPTILTAKHTVWDWCHWPANLGMRWHRQNFRFDTAADQVW